MTSTFGYRTFNDSELLLMTTIHQRAAALEFEILRTPDNIYRDHAMKALEEAVLWSGKAIRG